MNKACHKSQDQFQDKGRIEFNRLPSSIPLREDHVDQVSELFLLFNRFSENNKMNKLDQQLKGWLRQFCAGPMVRPSSTGGAGHLCPNLHASVSSCRLIFPYIPYLLIFSPSGVFHGRGRGLDPFSDIKMDQAYRGAFPSTDLGQLTPGLRFSPDSSFSILIPLFSLGRLAHSKVNKKGSGHDLFGGLASSPYH